MNPLVQLTDTHAHLDGAGYDADRAAVITRATAAGVTHILTVGCDLKSSQAAVELAKSTPHIYAAVGIHPHDAATANAETRAALQQLIVSSDKVVAVGEMGLDYYRDRAPRAIQHNCFRHQIALAKEVNLPLIVHDRDAHDDVLTILREEDAAAVGGVLHCFSGDIAMAHACIELGFYISFPATITYPNNDALRAVARSISTDHLLIETDCPYLSPQKFRGKRNEPAYLRYTAEKLAEIKGLSLADISRITSLNAYRLFGIGDIDQSARIAYAIRDSLYLNITNRCTNSCTFCAKFKDWTVKGHQLKLEREPSVAEVRAAIGDPSRFREVVFCGYGEPLLRIDLVKEIAAWLKEQGCKVRVNTDGQANLVHQRNILPELHGLIDTVSVSLNAADAATYQHWCRSRFGEQGYVAVKEFLTLAKAHIPEVIATAVALPGLDMAACRAAADETGVKFRAREYNELG
ncbi:MAG: YchF/TatD family DNA exonuclease [Desulfuromonadales bacterium]|nr:YchF/TatD family DNA exonuclease [Desulfuromonadales bacterium]MDT8422189.1 YchF/TatD family DNA exonuclease [Desulfuromonadales bacterium]